MSRIIRVGAPGKLRRLRPNDLPADHDLRGSFLEQCDLSGLDLLAYDLTDMDIVGSPTSLCLARNVILPEGGTRYLMSRYVDWTGSHIPSDVSDLDHDLVVEVLSQHTASPGSAEAKAINWVRSHVSASYRNSWKTAIYNLVEVMGLTRKQVWDYFFRHAFAGYSRLQWRLEFELDEGKILTPDLPETAPDSIQVYGLPDGMERWLRKDWPFQVVRPDRYELARLSERALNLRWPGLAPWRCWWAQVTPNIIAVAYPEASLPDEAKARYNWWGQV